MKIAITHGDPNGIGYEVIGGALEDSRTCEMCTPIVYGNARILNHYRKMEGKPALPLNIIQSPRQARDGVINVINVIPDDFALQPGQATREGGRAALAALDRAVADVRAGEVDALVTAPINKDMMQDATFTFPGHTEYLEASFSDPQDPDHALMILFADNLRVALTTIHVPISAVAPAITKDNVLEHLRLFAGSLHRDFNALQPRIAVLALNPHAGENGLLGNEEKEAISPAIAEAMKEGIMAFGPYPADGFFGSDAPAHFDGVLAMYHDQGLAPFKTVAMSAGVNFTAGLDCVRTSPDHGTAYDIVGKGIADPTSMRHAIFAAIDIVRSRRNERAAHRRPLRRQHYDKGDTRHDPTILPQE